MYDCIGIGFGPANIAVAVAMHEKKFGGSVLFLEQNAGPEWQSEMLLAGSDIQHHPLRDFVTPINPRSKFGFLSYLKETGRLLDYLNLEQTYPPRSEYAGYVKWTAQHFCSRVYYNETITKIVLITEKGQKIYQITSVSGEVYTDAQ